jgi:predicted RNA methylase
MSKLSKVQIKAHHAACALLAKDALTYDERVFVIENWQESATHINSAAGAYFTPLGLARDFSIEVSGGVRVIDLCAGIGALSLAVHDRGWNSPPQIVCVEKNPDYVAVGRKVLPEATWICADVFDLPDLGAFDFGIANPPFGQGGPIKGVTLDLNVVAVAAGLAEYGVFILPSGSVPFRLSGIRGFEQKQNAAYERFTEKTGITLGPSCGIDCDFYRSDWRGVAPSVEIAVADFAEMRAEAALKAAEAAPPAQADLFGAAA